MKKTHRVLLFIFLLVVFGGFLLPGIRGANDFPYISNSSLISGFNLPQVWSDRTGSGLGENVGITLWSWPIDFLFSIGGKLGISFTALTILIFILPVVVLGAWGIQKLLGSYGVTSRGKLIGTIFFLTNTYILLLIDGGQLSVALAYAWFPNVYVELERAFRGKIKQKIKAALYLSLLGFFDIRFVLLIFILFLFRFLILFVIETKSALRLIKGVSVSGLIAGVVFLILNFYWLFPLYMRRGENLVPLSYDTNIHSFTTLFNALTLLQPHWYLNVFGKVTSLKIEYILIPLLLFFVLFMVRRSKIVGLWVGIALISVFLTKGDNPPYGWIYTFLYTHVSGFSLFRDSTKFFTIVSLSYTVLFALGVDKISKRFSYFTFLILIYLFVLVSPVYTGKMTGMLSRNLSAEGYIKLGKVLENDREFGRVFWIPSRSSLGYADTQHPAAEALRLALQRPFAIGTVGTYEIFNFLRESPFVGEIFNISAIKYIVYPYPDIRRETLTRDNIDYYNLFLSQISSLDWIAKVENYGTSSSPLPLITVKRHQAEFFVSPNLWGIVGSDEIYSELVKLKDFNLTKSALVFLEERPGLVRTVESGVGRILLFKKDDLDLKASFFSSSDDISFSAMLTDSPDLNGWWKKNFSDVLGWRAFLQEKYGIDNLDFSYGGGWAVAEGKKKLEIKNLNIKSGGKLLARVMKSSRGGSVSFFQNGVLVGKINTKSINPEKISIKFTGATKVKETSYEKSEFKWVEVGVVDDGGILNVETEGDLNVVDVIAIADREEWDDIENRVAKLKALGRIIDWDNFTGGKNGLFDGRDTPNLTYKKISPTHYKLDIEGIKAPVAVGFSENYDPRWELNGVSSIPLYSLINGFVVAKDGEYDIVYSSQKYVDFGARVSIVAFVLTILIFIIL